MTLRSGRAMDAVGGRLAVAAARASEDVVEAIVSGELDLATTPELDAALSSAFAAGPCRTLVLDLESVTVLDSTGLRALWTIRREMREAAGRLVLRRPSQTVVHVLVATDLEAMFEIENADASAER